MLNVLGLINLQYNKVCNTNTKYSSFILHQSWYSNCNSFRKVILKIYFEQKEEKEGNVQIKIKNEIFVANVKINLEMIFLLACVSKKSFCFLTKANCSDWLDVHAAAILYKWIKASNSLANNGDVKKKLWKMNLKHWNKKLALTVIF
jgi:hypothetical protein